MGGEKLLDQIFNLKFTAKQLARSAVKCEKEEKAEKLKASSFPAAQFRSVLHLDPEYTGGNVASPSQVKKAIEKGNMEGAKIYAQNAIRKKNEQLNYMKLASRLDATVSRLETQAKMQMVGGNWAGSCSSPLLWQPGVCGLTGAACVLHVTSAQVQKNMAGIVKSLEKAMASNNLETIANTMTQVGRSAGVCALARLAEGVRVLLPTPLSVAAT
jgi:hypothetical protein